MIRISKWRKSRLRTNTTVYRSPLLQVGWGGRVKNFRKVFAGSGQEFLFWCGGGGGGVGGVILLVGEGGSHN